MGSDGATLATGGIDWAGCWVDQERRSDWTRWLTVSKSSRESMERLLTPAVGVEVDIDAVDVDAVEDVNAVEYAGATGAIQRRAACVSHG